MWKEARSSARAAPLQHLGDAIFQTAWVPNAHPQHPEIHQIQQYWQPSAADSLGGDFVILSTQMTHRRLRQRGVRCRGDGIWGVSQSEMMIP